MVNGMDVVNEALVVVRLENGVLVAGSHAAGATHGRPYDSP